MEAAELKHRYQQGERNFNQVDLSGADLGDIDLSRCSLTGANLSDCYLSEPTLVETDLRYASLLRETKVAYSSFCQSDLRNAELTEIDWELANLQGAIMPDRSLSDSISKMSD